MNQIESNCSIPINNLYARCGNTNVVIPYNDLPTVSNCHSTRILGIAPITNMIDLMSMDFYNTVAKEYHFAPLKRFHDLNEVDICNENVKKLLGDHAQRCRQGRIPHGWSKDGGFRKPDTAILAIGTVLQYTKPLLQLLKRLCPDHVYLHGDDQQWWKHLQSDLKAGYEKSKIRGEHESFDPKCAALYILNKPSLVRYSLGNMNIFDQIDLHYVVKNLKKTATRSNINHLRIARLVFCAHAVCRSGELKFCRISNFVYDPRFNVLDTGWCEIKTCHTYAMPMINHSIPSSYMVDFYHALGSAFVTVSEILKRYDGDLPDFLFPDLHAKTDSWVAMQNTKDIRKSLPEDLKISDRYSSKSMRRGACTVMTSNHKLKESHALARSGHGNSANHFGTYVENVGIGLSIPAAMVLNEYEDPYRMPVLCSFG